MNHFVEIAKLRAGRLLWAKLVSQFQPKDEKSLMLRTHCQTSGWSLTEQDPYNNVARTAVEAMAAVLGGTQSLHTNSFDEAIALPTDYSAKIARETQIYIQKESGITQVIDPWAGSYLVEFLTAELVQKAWKHLEEVKEWGGMSKAIEKGIPKMRIEEAAARKQAKIDSSKDKIVGVNIFSPEEKEDFDILEVDNHRVREMQIEKLIKLKQNRSEAAVRSCLDKIREACLDASKNLLALAVEAARNRATLGEISFAMEESFGRFKAVNQTISGVYAKEIQQNEVFMKAKDLAHFFAKREGRRPRIMIAKLGQDGHDRGAKIIATSFADLGFDVDMGPLFQTPEEAAMQAAENDVHILGLSSLAGGHKTLVPQTIKALQQLNRADIKVVAGGVIPTQDYPYLFEAGVKGVFGPGTSISKAAIDILELLIQEQDEES
jgi:methylmalonyl-CoA mutase